MLIPILAIVLQPAANIQKHSHALFGVDEVYKLVLIDIARRFSLASAFA